MCIKDFIQSGLSVSDLKILLAVFEAFGYSFSVSYKQIGNKLGVSYECIRKHFITMEKAGYIQIERANMRKLIFHLNREQINKLIG